MTDTAAERTLFEPEVKQAPLKVWKLDLQSIMGLEEFHLEAGPHWNLVLGENGSGKTSLLSAISNVLAGGVSLGNLARIGPDGKPEEPKAVLIIKGAGLEEYQITKTAKGVTIKERVGNSAAFKPVAESPGEWLRKVFDASRCSPAKFLLAKEQDQLTMFLEALPVKMNVERVKEIVGRFWSHVEKANLSWEWLHPMQALAAIKEAVRKAREGVNVSYRQKRDTAEQMLLETPAEIPDDIEDQIAEKGAEIDRLAESVTTRKAAIQSEFRSKEAEATSKRDAAIAAARAQFDRDIAAAQASVATMKEEATELERELDRARSERAELNATLKATIEAQTKRATAEKFQQEAASLEGEAKAMTAVLDGLDLYKEEMASVMPIKGLTIEGGLKIDGVPFASCNTAARVAVAFQVGLFGAQRLRCIFVDGFEALDSESRAEILRLAEEHDVQLFAAQVSDGSLEIEKS